MQTDIFWTLSWPFSCDYSFWHRNLKFSMFIKDSKHNTWWKNGKDLSNRASKIKLWNHTKKRIFRFLPKISAGHGWSWKNTFANFQILGPLGCQGWVAIPQNVKKKSKSLHPNVQLIRLVYTVPSLFRSIYYIKGAQAWDIRSLGFSWFLHHEVSTCGWLRG